MTTKSNQTDMEVEMEPKTKRGIPTLALVPLIVFSALAGLFGYQLISGNDPQEIPSVLIDKQAPEFTVAQVPGLMKDGKHVPGFSNHDLFGKISVVNVFASWCAPCRAEHPFLMDLAEDGRIQMAGLNYKDKTANAINFMSELGNPYDLVGADSGTVGIEWGVYGVPETFIVDEQGRIRYKFVGPLSEASYRDVFLPELEKIIVEAN